MKFSEVGVPKIRRTEERREETQLTKNGQTEGKADAKRGEKIEQTEKDGSIFWWGRERVGELKEGPVAEGAVTTALPWEKRIQRLADWWIVLGAKHPETNRKTW